MLSNMLNGWLQLVSVNNLIDCYRNIQNNLVPHTKEIYKQLTMYLAMVKIKKNR